MFTSVSVVTRVPNDVQSGDLALFLVIQTNSSRSDDADRPSYYAGTGRGRSPSISRKISWSLLDDDARKAVAAV